MTGVRFPVGVVDASADGRPRLRLRRDQGEAALDRLHGLDPALFLRPTATEERPDGLALVFLDERPRSVALPQAAQAWRRNLAVHVPLLLELGRFLSACARALRSIGWAALPPAPMLVRYTPQVPDPFRLLVLPRVAAVALADWADADPEARSWSPPELLFDGAAGWTPFCLGAALYTGFVGDLLPAGLSPRERLVRLMRGHYGRLEQLAPAIRAAVPIGLAGPAEALAALVCRTLAAQASARPPWADVDAEYHESMEALGVHRLASHWDHERAGDRVHALLSSFADWQRPEAVPWTTLARVRANHGDGAGALVAARRAIELGQDAPPWQYLTLVRRLAGDPEQRVRLVDAIAEIEGSMAASDACRLLCAHLELRVLGAPHRALPRLEVACREPWHEAVRLAMRARVLLDQDDFVLVSRCCKDALTELKRLPGRGGHAGDYLRGYIGLLDGAANFAAMAALHDTWYVIEAFQRFTQALDAAQRVSADSLAESCERWLRWIGKLAATYFPELLLGVQGYLQARGFAADGPAEPPTIPWFAESLLDRAGFHPAEDPTT